MRRIEYKPLRARRLAAESQLLVRDVVVPSLGRAVAIVERTAAHRPRFLLHGVVAIIGLTLLATATSSAPPPTPSAGAEGGGAVSAQSPSLVDLPMQELQAPPVTSDEVASPPPAGEENADAATPEPTPAKPIVHAVAEGETIRMLAARYGVDPGTILSVNHLSDPDMLQVGEDLVILPTDGVLHTLQEGESIRRVAELYGVEIDDIVKANDLGPDPDLVQAGTPLVVPGAIPLDPSAAEASSTSSGSTSGVAQGGDEPQQQAAVLGNPVPISAGTASRAMPSTRTYEVQPGDTLVSIADTFGVDVSTILSNNGIDDADSIKPGSELRILPVKGLEYKVQPSETLADIAWKYQVDLGVLLDYNDLNDADVIRTGAKLVVPNGKPRADAAPAQPAEPQLAAASVAAAPVRVAAPAAPAPKPVAAAPAPKPVAAAPTPKPVAAAPAPKPAAPAAAAAPKPAPAPEPPARASGGGGGGGLVANAMKYVGSRYVFGGTSPAGFDCSGFVYYVHSISGSPVGRGMWQQYNGGSHIPISSLQPGDTVFFANTYMPGLSHDGIYIGGGQFIHANDERTGVTISSMNTAYWTSHYAGATRD